MSNISNIKKIGRPKVGATPLSVRMPPEELAALDTWIATQPDPKPSRPEAMRRLAKLGLPRTTNVSVSDEQHSWGGDAVMTTPKPRTRK